MSTALLLMDLQNCVLNRFPDSQELLKNISQAANAARAAKITIIYVVVKFRDGYPEISEQNKLFAALKSGALPLEESNSATAIHPAVAPHPSDIVVTKRRVSAFSGSDLEIILRTQKIEHIVLSGIATSGVVLSTLRQAADLDYTISVLSDCCYDADKEVHDLLTEKIFPMQASVLTVQKWLQSVDGLLIKQ